MSTRATITVADERDSFDLYQHHDGYPDGPHGLVRHLAMARLLAWSLPRFEAADFAAAVIAVLKDRGGSTYLTKDADAHSDRSFHYRIEPVRENFATRVRLTITRPTWQADEPNIEIFCGDILDAVAKFQAIGETAKQPREYQILMTAEGSLWRAHEEISALCGERPDPDTQQVYGDIEDASRDLAALRLHLERMAPWHALKQASEGSIEARLAYRSHQRFQRTAPENEVLMN
jgi:hypothetical protein